MHFSLPTADLVDLCHTAAVTTWASNQVCAAVNTVSPLAWKDTLTVQILVHQLNLSISYYSLFDQ